MSQQAGSAGTRETTSALIFKWAVVLPVLCWAGVLIATNLRVLLDWRIGFWIAVVAFVGLLPVPAWKGLQLSLNFPILLGVAILYPPTITAVVAFVGSFDLKEVRRETPVLNSAFNRCQLALSFYAGSWVVHAVAKHPAVSHLYVLALGGVLATAATYALNVFFVTAYMRLAYRIPLGGVLSQLRVGALSEFLLSYLGLGFVGVIIAQLWVKVGVLSVAVFILPLVFARQMFFRTKSLEDAHKELQDRERVLRALSNRMAEERQDERMQIAGYLHDDLAQMLFRLSLQLEMAKKKLSTGELDDVNRHLEELAETKQATSDMVRALIRDLHRSPIGRAGLAEAISSFAEDMSKGAPTQILADVVEVSLPPPIQLLIYQISREAAMNALKHAEADHIWVTLKEIDDGVVLEIRDDGRGFDTDAAPPEGHFGSVMMRERALVAGGTFSIHSELGRGTSIQAWFPKVWVEEGNLHEASKPTPPPPPHPGEEAEPTVVELAPAAQK